MSKEARTTIYFASDFHLGVPSYEKSLDREKAIVSWLDHIAPSAKEIFLVGDLFDFWFEYKHAIPKGFVRLQGKIAELADSGIPIHVFTGNHDMWIFDYLPKELGIQLHREPVIREFNGKKFLIGHGDGLGPGDRGYKFIKKVFQNKFCQWCFARLHPNFGIWLANYSSRTSRAATGQEDEIFLGKENEWLYIYCQEVLQNEHFDYFIFGHRHLPLRLELTDRSTYLNLGDWIKYRTYLIFDGEKAEVKEWHSNGPQDYKISL
ncbi:MAG: UDP-2,3-diacylglucosamine diphosphatase [Flavobacteriia bacterium]|jgi:UDP-2,3-diacylglucosamine hydrolase